MSWTIVKNSWSDTSIYGADGERICLLDLNDWDVTEDNQSDLELVQASIAQLISQAPRLLTYLIMAADELEATRAEGHVLDTIRQVIIEAQSLPPPPNPHSEKTDG